MTFIRPDSKARAPLARSLMIGAGGPRGPRPMSQASNWDAIKAAIFLSTYLLREAISAGTQRPSAVALRRHQQWHPEAIRGHPRSSEVIRDHPRSSEVIRDHQRLRFSHRCRSNAVHAQRTARHDAVRCCRQQRQARGRRLQGSVPMEEASEGRKGGRLAPDEGRHHRTIRGNQRRSFMNQSAIRLQS